VQRERAFNTLKASSKEFESYGHPGKRVSKDTRYSSANWHLFVQICTMAQKNRYNVSLPDHVSAEIEARARAVRASPTEYAGDVIRWWFGQGCPAISTDEEEQQKRSRLDVWNLNPSDSYNLSGDALVSHLMTRLGVPNLFAGMLGHDEGHAFVAFDNHPTHWIVLHQWKGHEAAQDNGLLFQADPKVAVTRQQMLTRLQEAAAEMGAKKTVKFSQLPLSSGQSSNQTTTEKPATP
jgi:hypothetical protein